MLTEHADALMVSVNHLSLSVDMSLSQHASHTTWTHEQTSWGCVLITHEVWIAQNKVSTF